MPDLTLFKTTVTRCLQEMLTHLGVEGHGPGSTLEELLRDYGTAKARQGRKAVADKLGLSEADLGEVDRSLRRAGEALAGPGDRNTEIACLRLLLWFETIWPQALGKPLEFKAPTRSDEEIAQKQVRAIELICRALLAETHGTEPQLVTWLREVFRPEIVDKWVKAGSPGDVLSGTTFSELAGLFVSDESFGRYRALFERTEHLSFAGDKRRTLQAFLEDVRRIRNHFAHHKAVSSLQLALLERYFEEMSAPIQAAFDRGETQVNPDTFIDVSKEQLAAFFTGVREDIAEVKGDLAALRASLEGQLGRIGADVAGTARTVQQVDRRLQYTLAGVAALVVIGGLAVYFGRDSSRRAAAIQSDTAQIKADTTAVAQAAQKAEVATAAVQSGVAKVEEQARQLGSQAEALRKDGVETKTAALEAAAAAKAASAGIQDAAGRMEGAAQKTAEAVREVAGSVQAVASLGGIIPNPATPEDFYRNARLHELRNEFAAARRNYESYLQSNPDSIDPYLSYAMILKTQEGIEGARAVFGQLRRTNATPSLRTAAATLLPHDPQERELRAIVGEFPEYGPAAYLLSGRLVGEGSRPPTFAERKEERKLLGALLDLHQRGGFVRHLLDKPMAEAWIKDAETRVAATYLDEIAANPIQFTVFPPIPPHQKEWQVTAMIVDPGALSAEYSIDKQPLANGELTGPLLKLSLPVGDHSLEVFYLDARGIRQGPFVKELSGDDTRLAMAKSVVKTSRGFSASYVPAALTGGEARLHFRMTLCVFGDKIRSVRYGIDREVPDSEVKVPPDPLKLSITASQGGPDTVDLPSGAKSVSFQFVFTDGSTSAIFKKSVE
jgi:hypothetical protein